MLFFNIKSLVARLDQDNTYAEDTRGRKPAPIFGVENRNRLSERVMQKRLQFSTPKIGAGFRRRLERVLFRGRFSEARDR